MLVFLALGNAKVLSFALGDAKVPNASSFASQWNIGLMDHTRVVNCHKVILDMEETVNEVVCGFNTLIFKINGERSTFYPSLLHTDHRYTNGNRRSNKINVGMCL